MKRYFLTNLTTMVMALFLSFLTWFYLFTQGNGPAEIDVRFMPQLDMKDFASVAWEDAEGRDASLFLPVAQSRQVGAGVDEVMHLHEIDSLRLETRHRSFH